MNKTSIYQLLTKYYCEERAATGYFPDGFVLKTAIDKSLCFGTKKEMFDWFKHNTGNLIPEIRKIDYVGNYEGLTDVVKITGLSSGNVSEWDDKSSAFNTSIYTTALTDGLIAIYDSSLPPYSDLNLKWKLFCMYNISDDLESIYDEFEKKGIVLNNNVYKTKKERIIDSMSLLKEYHDLEEKIKEENIKWVSFHDLLSTPEKEFTKSIKNVFGQMKW